MEFSPPHPALLKLLQSLTPEKEFVVRMAIRQISYRCRVDLGWAARVEALLTEVNPNAARLEQLLREVDTMARQLEVR